MRKKDETMRDTLLASARHIADTEGAGALNIRRLAMEAGVATGTVYNYFQSKEDVLLALTEEYWQKALLDMRLALRAETFIGQVAEMYAFLRERIADSGGALMGSLRDAEEAWPRANDRDANSSTR